MIFGDIITKDKSDGYKKLRYSYMVKNVLHVIAMNAPHWRIARFFYKLRGTKIGDNVAIGHQAFLEETRPWLIEIGNDVVVGPRTIITVQDGSYHRSNPEYPTIKKKVVIEDSVYIGAGVNIIRGVRIGENSIIGAGSVVIHDIPPNSVAVGNPARVIKSTKDLKLAET